MSAAYPLPIPTLAEEVAALLGPDWRALRLPGHAHSEGRAVLRMGAVADCPELGFRPEHGRLVVSGLLPRGDQGQHYGTYPSITVALSRPALEVAREVERRLLPSYLGAHTAALAGRRADREARAEALALALRLAVVLGDSGFAARADRAGDSAFGVFGEDVRAEVRLSGLVHFEADADPRNAERVARALVVGAR